MTHHLCHGTEVVRNGIRKGVLIFSSANPALETSGKA
jgi:hypothetical protein